MAKSTDLFDEIKAALETGGDGSYPDTWRPEAGDTIVGKYVSMEEEVGKYSQNVYVLEDTETGAKTSVFGNVVMDDKMAEAEFGDTVGIKYIGKQKNYHNYNVVVRHAEE